MLRDPRRRDPARGRHLRSGTERPRKAEAAKAAELRRAAVPEADGPRQADKGRPPRVRTSKKTGPGPRRPPVRAERLVPPPPWRARLRRRWEQRRPPRWWDSLWPWWDELWLKLRGNGRVVKAMVAGASLVGFVVSGVLGFLLLGAFRSEPSANAPAPSPLTTTTMGPATAIMTIPPPPPPLLTSDIPDVTDVTEATSTTAEATSRREPAPVATSRPRVTTAPVATRPPGTQPRPTTTIRPPTSTTPSSAAPTTAPASTTPSTSGPAAP